MRLTPLLLPILAASALAAPLAAQLPPSIGQATNPANGHVYHILDESTWTDAEAAAVAMGGHLTTIDDLVENDWIYATFGNWNNQPRDLWIGLNDIAVEGTFGWSSSTAFTYSNWAPGQPDNYTGNDPVNGEDHVHMYGFNSIYGPGMWNDMHDALPGSASWTFGMYGIVELEGPIYSITGLVAGGTATISVENATPGGDVILGFSLVGPGPTMTPFGLVEMSMPITRLPPLAANAAGSLVLYVGIPPNVAGLILYTQGVDFTTRLLTNPLAEPFL